MTDSVDSSKQATVEQAEGRRDLINAFLLCILTVVLVRSFLFEPFKIPSSSMVPTLKIGDHIFVSKYNYGLSIPFTKIELTSWGGPKRGEIIVFLFPKDESLHYIKRVVGVPGDTIEFRGRDLLINGNILPKERVTDPNVLEQVTGRKEPLGEVYLEKIDDVSHYIQFSRTSFEVLKNNQVWAVPPDSYFVVGDNRDDSYDSRSWQYVPRKNIKGRAQMIWLSLDQETEWGNLNKVRWSRCGALIR